MSFARSSQRFTRFAFVALALIMLAMQSLALVHRIAHANHSNRAQISSHEITEPWLIVANGGLVSAEDWQRMAQDNLIAPSSSNDPWHVHDSTSDCERFDAVAATLALIDNAPSQDLLTANTRVFARDYVANLVARTPRAHARAPPRATSLA